MGARGTGPFFTDYALDWAHSFKADPIGAAQGALDEILAEPADGDAWAASIVDLRRRLGQPLD